MKFNFQSTQIKLKNKSIKKESKNITWVNMSNLQPDS
jgi:hypothetical protein